MIEFAPDPCEWNPEANRPAVEGDAAHADATLSLGDGEWHVCEPCSRLPRFAHYTTRKAIRRAGGTV